MTEMVTRIRKGAKAHLYIEEWMRDRGLNDETLGGRLGVARQTVHRWRKEQHRLDPGKIAKIAHALDLDGPETLWRPPGRPSLDAKMHGASDDEVKRAASMIDLFLSKRSSSG